jgi:hypothetical protein
MGALPAALASVANAERRIDRLSRMRDEARRLTDIVESEYLPALAELERANAWLEEVGAEAGR